jgi:transcriptional regulator with XRE-family HTH domain
VNVSLVLRLCRHRARVSLRSAAAAAGTSHATWSAYEHQRVVPSVDTLDRLVRANGNVIDVTVVGRIGDPGRGAELEAVLDLAEQFPARHDTRLRAPVFGRRP